ncbi:MAG: hypothetical protein ABSG17_09160 [Spirochaetia bacterium]|jgi:predicted  nucleic acid-binding Zn-ribbon protein
MRQWRTHPYPIPILQNIKVFRDPNDEIKEAVEKRDAQLQPQIAALAAQAREADLLRKQNRSLRSTLTAKDKHIARLDEEIRGLRKWIQRAREALIEGGAKLAAFRDKVVRDYNTWQEEVLAKRQDRHRTQERER